VGEEDLRLRDSVVLRPSMTELPPSESRDRSGLAR
jgi:hypothetical protein